MKIKTFTLSIASLAILSLLATGTWTEVEPDGDKEIKQVSFEPENQRVIIGDDVKIYTVNGNQMIIDDMDREASDRVVLTKQ